MRHISASLVLLAVLAGPLARANPDQSFGALGSDHASRAPLFAAAPGGDVLGRPQGAPLNGWSAYSRKTVLKVHPLTTVGELLLSVLTSSTILMLPLEMELAVHPNVSLSVMATPIFLQVDSTSTIGLGLNGGVRTYFSSNAPNGLWLGGEVMITMFSTGSWLRASYGLQPQIGYQWVLENGFTIGLGVGLAFGDLAAGWSFQVPVGFAW